MSTSAARPPVTRQDEVLGEDLASLACNVAIELDNLILGRSNATASVRKLANRLTSELPTCTDSSLPKHLVDPSTVVVMN